MKQADMTLHAARLKPQSDYYSAARRLFYMWAATSECLGAVGNIDYVKKGNIFFC